MTPLLVLVTDREVGGSHLLRAVEDAVAGGVDRVQVRERGLPGAALLRHVEDIAAASRRGAARRGGSVEILVNRFIDVALAAGADGVHLGFDAIAPADARALVGAEKIVTVACHGTDEILKLPANVVDQAQLAPIYAPRSKASTRPPLGPQAIAGAAGGPPVIAQGGIDPPRAATCIAAGAVGVAVTGALLLADSPCDAARAFRRALDAVHPVDSGG